MLLVVQLKLQVLLERLVLPVLQILVVHIQVQLIQIQMVHLVEILHRQTHPLLQIILLKVHLMIHRLHLLIIHLQIAHQGVEMTNLVIRQMSHQVTQMEKLKLKERMEVTIVMKETILHRIKRKIVQIRKIKNQNQNLKK